jgi:hypothetical protein
MKNTLYIVIMSAVLAGTGCQPTLIAEFQDLPVVEGYLFAGEPASVHIGQLIPFRGDVSFNLDSADITRLNVEITDLTDDLTYTLTSQGGGVYTDSTLLPAAGHAYQLQFTYNDQLVSATTEIAASPQGVTFSKSSITVTSFGGGMFGGGVSGGTTGITVGWDNPDAEYYAITIESTDPNRAYIMDSTASFVLPSTLTTADSAEISPMQFRYTGKHRVRLCRVQPEYVVFFGERGRSASQLVEVHANIDGGFGIFTGISSYDREITVYE